MTPLDAQPLDVGRAGLAHPQPVQSEEHGQSGMGMVGALGGEQKDGM